MAKGQENGTTILLGLKDYRVGGGLGRRGEGGSEDSG